MVSLPSRALPSMLLVALLAGCARWPGIDETAPAQAPEDEPAEQAVTAQDIERNPSQPIERLLMMRVPGVWVTRTPDGGIAVRIRGTSTIHGRTAPLYVLDGVPIQAGPYGSLTGVNPYDIESITVLKGPADLTMYGSRGANGVIVITTKRC